MSGSPRLEPCDCALTRGVGSSQTDPLDLGHFCAEVPKSLHIGAYPRVFQVAALCCTAAKPEGDAVLDPFCGCGTTLAVAEEHKRNWVGIDISPTAIDICESQLKLLGAEPIKLGMPESIDDLARMSGFEFQKWALNLMRAIPSPSLSNDKGIDGRMRVTNDPIQVKQKQAGRPDVDNFQTAIERAGHDRGWLVAFGFSRKAIEEIARVKRARGMDIIPFDAKELLKAAPVEKIVREARKRGQQMSFDEFVVRAPKTRPKVDDLVASELRSRAEREHTEAL